MHVDVDLVRSHLDEQMHFRTALLDGRHAVRIDDGVRDRAVSHDAAVDEDMLRAARRTLLDKRRREPANAQATRLLRELDQIGPVAVNLEETIADRGSRRPLKDAAR